MVDDVATEDPDEARETESGAEMLSQLAKRVVVSVTEQPTNVTVRASPPPSAHKHTPLSHG